MELDVLIEHGQPPSARQLEILLAGKGFQLRFEPFDWADQDGPLRMTLDGKTIDIDVDIHGPEDEGDAILTQGGKQLAWHIRFMGDDGFDSCTCGYAIAGAISELTGARIHDPLRNQDIDAAFAFAEAAEAMKG